MFRKLVFIISLTAFVVGTHAQNIGISGRIIDKELGTPVAGVHVAANAGEVTITDSTGLFRLTVRRIPTTLKITHVTYGTSVYEVTSIPKELIVIRISQKTTDLDEVQISARRLRIITPKDQYSIQDYGISDKAIWFLGFINNQANRQRLFLANLYGDTLASIPVKGAERIFTDVFQNVHLVLKDSVFQLFHDEGQILLLYPVAKEWFYEIMEPVELAFGQKLVYSRATPGSKGTLVYYIREGDTQKYLLAILTDSAYAIREVATRKIDAMMARWGIPELANMWTTLGRYNKRGTKFDRIIRQPVPYELFTSADSLYLINYMKDSLLQYSLDGQFTRALRIDFHKEMHATGPKYKSLTCLTDPITQKVFLIDRQLARWIIQPLILPEAKAEAPVNLPDFPGMDQIRVYDKAIYFLYPDKQHPYYNLLYRYQL
ncbi:MAG TPA: hypothetical protein DC042_07925 [Bacteroidales bacterium]|nr:hypothetical protein [Bacteroidales bacterium]